MTDRTFVSSDRVKARWAYSELLSPNVGHFYRGVEPLKGKAGQEVRFEDLSDAELVVLAHKFNEVRGAYFDRYFAGVAQFAFKHWAKSELGTAHVIPYFSPETMTFEQWIESAEAPSLPKDDPRWELNSAMPFNQVDPITVGRNSGARVLLDGYHRACRFWGRRDAALTLAVYLPV